MSKCFTHYDHVGKFISNVNGDWRNSIYITCSVCKYSREECCDDMLASFDADGIPTLIMAKDANFIYGTIMDKSECLCEISNAKFKCLYEKYFQKRSNGALPICPFLQVANGEFIP